MSKIVFTDKEFLDLRTSAEELYKKIGEVFCPALKCSVVFNSLGLQHLVTKRWNHVRDRGDQYMRLKLLHLVPVVLKMSHTIQGKSDGQRFERIKVNSRWEEKMVHITYYEFIAIINGYRLRVVIKQINTSSLFFWSIIPYWKQGNRGREMFEGNPEED